MEKGRRTVLALAFVAAAGIVGIRWYEGNLLKPVQVKTDVFAPIFPG